MAHQRSLHYFADNTDAKIETMKEIFTGSTTVGSDQWLGYNRLLESNVRRTSK